MLSLHVFEVRARNLGYEMSRMFEDEELFGPPYAAAAGTHRHGVSIFFGKCFQENE